MLCDYITVLPSFLRNLRWSGHATLPFIVTLLIPSSPRSNAVEFEFGDFISKQQIRKQRYLQSFVCVRSTTFKRSLFITGSLLHEYPFSFCPQEFGIQSVWHSLFRCLSLQMTRYNRQRVLSLQASLVQYAESRLKNGRDTYAILAKLMNDLKKSY